VATVGENRADPGTDVATSELPRPGDGGASTTRPIALRDRPDGRG
jgi:hypothetical protein